jgi:AraC-like DNA-binding protein
MNFDLSFILSILVAFQLFYVSIFLFIHKRGNSRNNKILGLIFLLFALSICDFTIRVVGFEIPVKGVHLIDDGFIFLYGPLIYLYTNCVVYKNFKLKLKHLLHLIPFVLFVIYLIVDVFSLNRAEQAQVTEQIFATDLPAWMFLASMPIYILLFIYLWFSNKAIIAYGIIIKNQYSSIDNINLNWLSFIIRFFTVITLIVMIHNTIPALGSPAFHRFSLIVLLVFTFYFVNKVLLKALNQPQIFSGITLEEKEKYIGSNLSEKELKSYKAQLINLMNEKKPYLDPDLSLQYLAKTLQTNPKVLSQVINQGFNQKFYDFVNTYRCEEVKNILEGSDDEVTIQEAMYQSGFNSKSSFNKEFKKLTGQTPSDFKKSRK